MTKFHNFSCIKASNISPVSPEYRLKVIQQPEQARATGRSKKFTGRRTIDPPPVIQVSLLHLPSNQSPEPLDSHHRQTPQQPVSEIDKTGFENIAISSSASTNSSSSSFKPANIIRHTLNPLILVATLIDENEPLLSANNLQKIDPEIQSEVLYQHPQKLNMASTIYNAITGNDKYHEDSNNLSNIINNNNNNTHNQHNSANLVSSSFVHNSSNNTNNFSNKKSNFESIDGFDNLVGTTSVVASMVSDDKLSYDEMKAVFIFSNLSVKQEGSYKLRFTLYEYTSYNTLYNHNTFVPNGGISNNSPKVVYRGGIDSNVFKVYTAKKFPGLNTSSKLSFDLKSSGTKIKVRHSIRSGNKKSNQASPEASSIYSQNSSPGTIPSITTTDASGATDSKLLPVHENPIDMDDENVPIEGESLSIKNNDNEANNKNSNNQNANNNNGSSAYYTFLKNRQPLMARTYIFGKRKNNNNTCNNDNTIDASKNLQKSESSLTDFSFRKHDNQNKSQSSNSNDDIEMISNGHLSPAQPSEAKRSFDSISSNSNNAENHYNTSNSIFHSNQSIHSRQSSSNSNNMYYNNSNHHYHSGSDIHHHHNNNNSNNNNNNNIFGLPPLRPTISNSSTTSSLQSGISSIASNNNNSNATNTPASTTRHTIGSFFASFHRSSNNKDVLKPNENKSPTLSVSPLRILSDVSSKQLPISAGSIGRPSPPVSPQYFANHNNNNNSSMMYFLQNHAGSSNTVSSHGSSLPYQSFVPNASAPTTHKIRSRNNTVVSTSSSQNFNFNFSTQNNNNYHQEDSCSNRNSLGSNSNNPYVGNANSDYTKRSSFSSLHNRSSSFVNNSSAANNNGGTTPIPLPNNSGAMTPTHNAFNSNNLLSVSGGVNTVNGSATTSRRPSESALFSQTTPIYFQSQSINSFASSLNLNGITINGNDVTGSDTGLAGDYPRNDNMQRSDLKFYNRELNMSYNGNGSQGSDDYDNDNDTNMEDVELPTPKKTKTDPRYKTAIMKISNIIN